MSPSGAHDHPTASQPAELEALLGASVDDTLAVELGYLETLFKQRPAVANMVLARMGELGAEGRQDLARLRRERTVKLQRERMKARVQRRLAGPRAAAVAALLAGSPSLALPAVAATETPTSAQASNSQVSKLPQLELRVTDRTSGRPLAGVRLQTAEDELVAITDANGRALIPGRYANEPVLTLEREGYPMVLIEGTKLAERSLISMKHFSGDTPFAAPPAMAAAPKPTVAPAKPSLAAGITAPKDLPTAVAQLPAPKPPVAVPPAAKPLPPTLPAPKPIALVPPTPPAPGPEDLPPLDPHPVTPQALTQVAQVPLAPVSRPGVTIRLPNRPARASLLAGRAPGIANVWEQPHPVADKQPPVPQAYAMVALPRSPRPVRVAAVAKIPNNMPFTAPAEANPHGTQPVTPRPVTPHPVAPAHQPSHQAAASRSAYRVKSGDMLSSIAQRELGSAARWSEIYEANRAKLSSPSMLRVGLLLDLPRGGGSAAHASHATGSYVVRAGDTLSQIAKDQLGDAKKWHQLFNANRHVIRDPRMIFPGQRLALPGHQTAALPNASWATVRATDQTASR